MIIENVNVREAYQASQQQGHIIIDVRSKQECAYGMPQDAVNINIDEINLATTNNLNKTDSYYLICEIGIRSQQAYQQFKQLGFKNLYNISLGYKEWHKQKLPTKKLDISSSDLRYQRHYQLKGFGKKAQDKLTQSHVLIIGVGGLGSSSTLYLAAAGVGEITIIDDDKVQLSNLQRQIIHTTESIDYLKVNSAKQQLKALNPEIKINTIAQKLDDSNVEECINQVDVVIDGTDNLSTRYLVNDTCVKLQKPLIYAAVYQYEAQISVFDMKQNDAACLRCLFPHSQGFEPENCSNIGVLGVVPGFAGILQATQAIKLITNIGTSLSNQLLVCNLLDNSFRKIKYNKDNQCKLHN